MSLISLLQSNVDLSSFSAPFGAAIVVVGAALGISKIGSSAMEAIARQPEAAGNVRSGMLLAAALIEGVALFALIICLMSIF